MPHGLRIRSPHRILLGLLALAAMLMAPMAASANSHCNHPELGISRLPVLGPLVSGDELDHSLLRDIALSNARREGYPQYQDFEVRELPDSDNARKLYCYRPNTEAGYVLWVRPGCSAVVMVGRRSGEIRRLIRDCAAALHAMESITAGARLAHAVHSQFGTPLQSRMQVPDREAEQILDYLSALPLPEGKATAH